MMSCIRRVWAGAGAPDRPIRIREHPRASEIPRLPRKFRGNQRPEIVLRTTPSKHLRRVVWAVEAAGPGGAWDRLDGGDGTESSKAGPCSYAVGEYRTVEQEGERSQDRRVDVAVAAAVTVVLGVGNRVLYKLALVPLKHYPFFLAQLATFGYVIVYFSVLYLRYRAGIVTDEMLSMPKAPFLAVGLLEALGAATGMAAGAILSGASIPVLSQTFLVWQILLSIIFLGRRYKVNQLLGCCFVAIGVIITVARIGKQQGSSVDLFVVNSFGSAFQAIFICLLLPFLSKLWGIPFGQLPNYLKDGAACFLNVGTLSNGCDGAPLLPLLFVVVNMGFNISLLHLLKISSAVVSSLASTFSVPISVYVFTLPLPYLGVAASLPTGFVSGTIILVIGLLIYAWTPSVYPTSASPSPPNV
ncbi:hypothetical protein ACE6H2_015495 [Prunus campanulata]